MVMARDTLCEPTKTVFLRSNGIDDFQLTIRPIRYDIMIVRGMWIAYAYASSCLSQIVGSPSDPPALDDWRGCYATSSSSSGGYEYHLIRPGPAGL